MIVFDVRLASSRYLQLSEMIFAPLLLTYERFHSQIFKPSILDRLKWFKYLLHGWKNGLSPPNSLISGNLYLEYSEI
jgi:hypothetical protein